MLLPRIRLGIWSIGTTISTCCACSRRLRGVFPFLPDRRGAAGDRAADVADRRAVRAGGGRGVRVLHDQRLSRDRELRGDRLARAFPREARPANLPRSGRLPDRVGLRPRAGADLARPAPTISGPRLLSVRARQSRHVREPEHAAGGELHRLRRGQRRRRAALEPAERSADVSDAGAARRRSGCCGCR